MHTVFSYAADIRGLSDPDVYAYYYALLPEERLERLRKLRRPEDRLRGTAAWGLLLFALDKWYGERRAAGTGTDKAEADLCGGTDNGPYFCRSDFALTEHGKPYLALPSAPHFTLSHSGNYVMCAVSDIPAGCDTERIPGPDRLQALMRVAAKYYTEKEQAALAACPDDVSRALLFCRLWTLKESYVKCTGKGLLLPFASFDVSCCLAESVSEYVPGPDGAPFRLHEYRCAGGSCFSVCAGPCSGDGAGDICFTELEETELGRTDHMMFQHKEDI